MGESTRGRGGARAARRAQRGAALAETIVLMVVMLPLMFAVPMIGKLVDLRQTAVQGARYAAWEATVHEAADAPAQLSERFFGDGKAPIVTGANGGGRSLLWGEGSSPTGAPGSFDAQTRIEVLDANVRTLRYEDVNSGSAVADGVGAAVEGIGDAMAGLGDGEWGIGDASLTRGGVKVKVERNGWLESLGASCADPEGCLQERAVILADGWSADRETAAKRVQALVPARVLDPLGEVLSAFGEIPFLKELKPLDDAFGRVNMEPLPESLRGGTTYGLDAYEEER